jgi:hypothetical protein
MTGLLLNSDKTYYLQFLTNSTHKMNINICCENKLLMLMAPNFLDYSLIVHYHGITILIK